MPEKEKDSKNKEENEWYKIEKKEVLIGQSRPPTETEPSLWQQVETPSRPSGSSDQKQLGSGSHNFRPEYDLEQKEREIIENLEREEREREEQEKMRQWKSMEQLKTMQPVEVKLHGVFIHKITHIGFLDISSRLKLSSKRGE